MELYGGALPSDRPSMRDIYTSDHWREVAQDELARGNARWDAAQDPMANGMVPRPAYADMFAPLMPPDTVNVSRAPGAPAQNAVMSLTGEQIPVEAFTHNNMQPYFRGSVRQNTDPSGNNTLLESYTGRGDLRMKKQEVGPLFEPTKGFTNPCGMANQVDNYLDRIVAPKARNNDFPIEQVRVGKGLGLGYTAGASGGFQQANTLDYVRPKTVDELRVLSKPKLTYEIPVQGPKKAVVTARGKVGEFAKNRPDTFFEQGPDMWLKTTGAVSKESQRGVFQMKPTARVDTHVERQGGAANTRVGRGLADDYGKENIMVYDNERMTTETRTVVSNLTSTVKAIVAPLLDVLRRTPKEYTLDAARTYGNMQAQMPSKPTTYDPVNHIMRCTIKETLIHDADVLNLKGHTEGTVHTMDDAKTTVRETTPVVDTVRNVNAHTYRTVVYDPDAVARTTMKELVENAVNESGYIAVDKNHAGAYDSIEVEVPHTQKMYLSDNDHFGVGDSKADFRPMSEDAAHAMEVDATREALNIASGHTPGAGGAYTGVNGDMVDMETKKLVQDSIAARETGNVTRVYQATAKPIQPCEVTKEAQRYDQVCDERLDTSLLTGLKSNPYALPINPIG